MENILHETKNCLYCKKQIKGRTDKKFCNDYCRNIFNNQINAASTNLMRNINHVIGKNRRILSFFVSEETIIKIKKEDMLLDGFQFKYYTHVQTIKTGAMLYCCYDVVYLYLDEETLLVTRV